MSCSTTRLSATPTTRSSRSGVTRSSASQHLSLHFNIGLDHELVTRSMQMFADDVMPVFRPKAGISVETTTV